MFAAKEQTVRDVLAAFNERGFSALDPKGRRGSMPRIGPAVREEIRRTAKSDPARLGDPTPAAQEAAIGRYLRWRNKHAQPKRHFAIGSKIRRPDYLPLAA
jgi:hypothetical protein